MQVADLKKVNNCDFEQTNFNAAVTVISHQKIATFTPVWASFRGYSLIFEDRFPQSKGSFEFTNSISNVKFFGRILRSLDTIGQKTLACKLLLFMLPPQTFHVTFADLINEGRSKEPQSESKEYANLREFALSPDTFASRFQILPTQISDLPIGNLIKQKRSMRFRYDGIPEKSSNVLFLNLAPADRASSLLVEELTKQRTSLMRKLGQADPVLTKSWRPHLTIGYFGNKNISNNNKQLKQNLEHALRKDLEGQILEFDAIGLYSFESMAKYFRHGPPSIPVDF